jgi:hypothetical protein
MTRSILLLEPARLWAPHRPRPLGLLTLHEFLRARGVRSTYLDLTTVIPSGGCESAEAGSLSGALVGTLREAIAGHDFVGLSVTYGESFDLAVDFAAGVHLCHPEKRVIVGGQHMTRMFLEGEIRLELFERGFDFIVVFDGELSLLKLLTIERDPTDRGNIPNLIHVVGREVCVNEVRNDLELSQLPLAFDSSGSDLIEYEIARGCYWHRCRFCIYRRGQFPYREKPARQIIEHLEELQDHGGARSLFFVTDSMSIEQARMISATILEKGLRFSWSTFIRFERDLDLELLGLMRRAGCKALAFGLESGDDRVNQQIVCKGIDLQVAARILGDCHAVGIDPLVCCVTGLPGETLIAALRTAAFLYRNRLHLRHVLLHLFDLPGYSEYVSYPQRYHLTRIFRRRGRYDFFAWRGAVYRHLLLKPFSALCYLYFNAFTEVDLVVPHSAPLLRSAPARLLDRLLRGEDAGSGFLLKHSFADPSSDRRSRVRK